MEEPRPSFTFKQGAEGPSALPLFVWAVLAGLAGATAGSLLAVRFSSCAGVGDCGPSTSLFALLPAAFAVAALAWLLLPARDSPGAAVRGALLLAGVGGAGCLALGAIGALYEPMINVGILPLALAAPGAMLAAIQPTAPLVLRGNRRLEGGRWLAAGSLPVACAGLGGALAYSLVGELQWYVEEGPYAAAFALALGGAGLVAVSGGLLLRSPNKPPSPFPEEVARSPPVGRRWAKPTPMMSVQLVSELSLTFAAGAVASVLLRMSYGYLDEPPAYALAIGVLIGAVSWAAIAPAAESRLGRGRLLGLALVSMAVAPLLLASYDPRGHPAPLVLAVCAMAFAWSASVPRFALSFDLSPSQRRLRRSYDLQGFRLLGGSAGFLADQLLLWFLPTQGLLLASAFAVTAAALFAPTLGALGRNRA